MRPLEIFAALKNRWQSTISTRWAVRPASIASRRPVISFTFDDFPASSVRIGGALLHSNNLQATYYAAFSLMGTNWRTGQIFGETELRDLVAQGHELGCHTFDHCDAWDTEPAVFESSIIENRAALSRWLPQAKFTSLSYPISFPRPASKRCAARHFDCCRGGGLGFNKGNVDLNFLHAVFLEKNRTNFPAIQRLIEANRVANGWLIFATHDISETPTKYGITPSFFADTLRCAMDSGALILPISAALSHVRSNP